MGRVSREGVVLLEVVGGMGFVDSPTGLRGVCGRGEGRLVPGLLVGVVWPGCCASRRLEGTEVDSKCQSVGDLE